MTEGPIVYDLDDLQRVSQGLATLATDYDTARDAYSEASGSVGDANVSQALDDFTDNWKSKRAKQIGMIRSAGQALDQIITSYRDIDESGAGALREGG